MSPVAPLSLAVFVGARGRGSNLMALHTATRENRLSARIAVVVGTRADAPALQRAQEAGLPIAVVDPKAAPSDDAYGDVLLSILRRANVDTITLAGYLRRLPPALLAAFPQRVVNVHPSLLPAWGGKGMYGAHVHEAVLAYGCRVSGCTVHFVDEAYDTGPIILQRAVVVEAEDSPETLAARILPHEHAAFVDALQLLAENRLTVEGRIVRIAEREPRP